MESIKLISPVRDNEGRYHRVGEIVKITSQFPRSGFDNRKLLQVTFEDNSRGAVFIEEVSVETKE